MTTYIGQALSLKASAVDSVDHYERNERARDIGPEDLNSGPEDLRLTGLTRDVELPPYVHLGELSQHRGLLEYRHRSVGCCK